MIRNSGSIRQASTGGQEDAHGLAVLLVGILLAVGTALPQFGTGAPAFPQPPVAGHADRSAEAIRETAHRAGGMAGPPAPRVLTPLDINTAGAEALQSLPGIGPVLAGRIVAEREAHGPFRAPDDLLRVPGIGPKRLDRIRPLVRLTGTS
jgi:competence ComEA-like helix-hairpin-helix protein